MTHPYLTNELVDWSGKLYYLEDRMFPGLKMELT